MRIRLRLPLNRVSTAQRRTLGTDAVDAISYDHVDLLLIFHNL